MEGRAAQVGKLNAIFVLFYLTMISLPRHLDRLGRNTGKVNKRVACFVYSSGVAGS